MRHFDTGTLQTSIRGYLPANPRRCYDDTDVTDVTGPRACRRARVTHTPLKALLYSLARVVTPCIVCNVCIKSIKTRAYKCLARIEVCNVPVSAQPSQILGGVQ